jgi:hypothetical protein
MPQRKKQLLDAAQRLCQQSEDMRARADRVMQHSEDLHRSHEVRRQIQKKRKTQPVR